MIIVRTPFRLPLGGGGTDLPSYYEKYECSLITAAINKYMYISINEPAVVNKIKINYSKTEIVDPERIEDIVHEIVRESLLYLNIRKPIEITSMADLSAGTGMGSSSSYTVGLLNGLNTMLRRYISIKNLAEESCKVEIDLIGKPIGKQDQYAAAYGGIIQLEINRVGETKVTPLNLEHEIIYELENRLMMFYTNIDRDANEILSEQSSKAKKDEKSVIKSMHKIKEIGYRSKDALINGDIDKFGELLDEHWNIKKKISAKMSNPDINRWYKIGKENGAIGGKIMGAGGGGFMLYCVKNGNRKKLRAAIEKEGLKYMDFRFDFDGSKVLFNI